MGNHHGNHGADHGEPQPLDPENDIDAKSSMVWVLGGTIVLFLSLWVMLPIFTRVQDRERQRKVDQVPAEELHAVQEAQAEFLGGANPTKRNLNQVLKDIASGK